MHCEQNQFKKFASFGSVLAQFSSTKPGYKTCHFLIWFHSICSGNILSTIQNSYSLWKMMRQNFIGKKSYHFSNFESSVPHRRSRSMLYCCLKEYCNQYIHYLQGAKLINSIKTPCTTAFLPVVDPNQSVTIILIVV